jgi:hypothetical protein
MRETTIRDALEAAAYTLDHHDERKVGAATSSEELAAIVIAAFLRSLPRDVLITHFGWSRDELRAMAEAVEKDANRAR